MINRNPKVTKEVSNEGLTLFYTNADQFVNKRDDLVAIIADDKPDIILIAEVIPKMPDKSNYGRSPKYR